MRIETLSLKGSSLGSTRSVTALHFGDEKSARKVYIQASLHADELPGALAAYHLRHELLSLEEAGQIKSHIVLVPLANPIGLGQVLSYAPHGRFDFSSGQNFNRLGALNVYQHILTQLKQDHIALGEDAQDNKNTIRSAMARVFETRQPKSELESLHLTLLQLAYDADLVIDLHCDVSAILHVYTLPQLWPVFEPLACFLGSECQLLEASGAEPFDELLSTVWTKLQSEYPDANIPLACAATTVELRGQANLCHSLASEDASAIIQYLACCHDISLPIEQKKSIPELKCAPHPLAGVDYVHAPTSGLVVYHVGAGQWINSDTVIADIVDPIEGCLQEVKSGVAGIVYARNEVRFAQKGDVLMSVSGPQDLGRGAHLSA